MYIRKISTLYGFLNTRLITYHNMKKYGELFRHGGAVKEMRLIAETEQSISF